MRFRNALRSPGLGFLTATMLAFFLYVFLVFLGRSRRLLIVGGGAAASTELVVNGALASTTGWIRGATGMTGRIRLRKAFADAMMAFADLCLQGCWELTTMISASGRKRANWASCRSLILCTNRERLGTFVVDENLQRVALVVQGAPQPAAVNSSRIGLFIAARSDNISYRPKN